MNSNEIPKDDRRSPASNNPISTLSENMEPANICEENCNVQVDTSDREENSASTDVVIRELMLHDILVTFIQDNEESKIRLSDTVSKREELLDAKTCIEFLKDVLSMPVLYSKRSYNDVLQRKCWLYINHKYALSRNIYHFIHLFVIYELLLYKIIFYILTLVLNLRT